MWTGMVTEATATLCGVVIPPIKITGVMAEGLEMSHEGGSSCKTVANEQLNTQCTPEHWP